MGVDAETKKRLKDSAHRLHALIDGGPPSIVVQECGLLLRTMASFVGPMTIRVWLDEWAEKMVADLELVGDGVECGACKGNGVTHSKCGRNPQCKTCRGLGRV